MALIVASIFETTFAKFVGNTPPALKFSTLATCGIQIGAAPCSRCGGATTVCEATMARMHPGTESRRWAWAAIGVDSSRARGNAETAEDAVASAIAAVGELTLLELRGPDGTVRRSGRIVERAEQCPA